MAEGLVKKRRIRAGHRGVVTKRLDEVRGILEPGEEGPRDVDSTKLAQLRLALSEKLETLKNLDSEILDLLESEEDIGREIEQADVFNQRVYETLVKIDRYAREASPRVTPSTARSLEGGAESRPPSAHNKTRLPKLILNKFDGDLTKWHSFWDSYDVAIHSNPELSSVDKFTYLRTLVEHSAKDAISGLSLTAANYDEAIDVLKTRFGDKQRIISKHMEILLGAESVSSATQVASLRRLYDKVESNVRSLSSLGVNSESYGSLLSPVLLQKLPPELRLIVGRQVSGEWTLDPLMKIFGEELRARERIATPLNDRQSTHARANVKPTTATLLTEQRSETQHICCYCQGRHTTDSCKEVGSAKERKQILRSSGRCFVCLRRGHVSRNCRSRGRCRGCGGRHHTTICDQTVSQTENGSTQGQRPPNQASTSRTAHKVDSSLNPAAEPFRDTNTACCHVNCDRTILLQTARVTIFNPSNTANQREINVILDTGSQKSYITESVCEALGIKRKGRRTMSIMTFGSNEGKIQCCDVVEIGLQLREGLSDKISVLSTPFICESIVSPPTRTYVADHEELRSLDLAVDVHTGYVPMNPDMLIGMDHYWSFVTGETIHCHDGPVALNTRFGWILSGTVPDIDSPTQHSTNLVTHVLKVDAMPAEFDRQLDKQLKKFWELESLGIVDRECTIGDQFSEVIKFQNGRYEVPLPWKDPTTHIPDNYQLSLKRLYSLLKRLKESPEKLQQYDQVIKEQLRLGIVEPVVNSEEDEMKGRRIHYLPHHGVIRKDKNTTKVRVVYDASARTNGPSLNDCLHVGPKHNQRIFDILLRFRTKKVALVADVEKAFLMIAVEREDRDVLRFLWVTDINKDPPDIIAMRFTRVVFGVASSPFLLNATVQYHVKSYEHTHPELVSQLLRSIYVDDVVYGAPDVDKAYQLFESSKDIMRGGGFNLRKFLTNNPQLQRKINAVEGTLSIPADSEGYTQMTLGKSQTPTDDERKVLGVRWDVRADELVIDVENIYDLLRQTVPTKRLVVSSVGRIYDPLGILSPVVVPFKIFFQELSQLKQSWDLPLSGEILDKWKLTVKALEGARPIRIPRFYWPGNDASLTTYRLCGFCDASMRAYAAVIYLVPVTGEAFPPCLVCSKTRVSPLQRLTIPRLELLSTVLLARLIHSATEALSTELNLEDPICFTDSMISYHWIRGLEKGWRPFVQNRVNEVRRLVPPSQWRHCPGSSNPADLPSRGQTLSELANSQLWFHGPEWLSEDSLQEDTMNPTEVPEECLAELQARGTLNLLNPTCRGLSTLINVRSTNDINSLLRVTAYVLLFVKKLKKSNPPLSDLVCQAETLWTIEAQLSLKASRHFDHWKRQWSLFLDPTGVWRCGGRLHNAQISYATKFPAILPNDHHFTTLVIDRAHKRVFHNGVKETLTEIRSRYWIPRGRAVVRQFIFRCTLCRRFESQAYKAPIPPLPPIQVQTEPPFTYTGVYFAGPLYVKTNDPIPNSDKVWICLYTCCITRAVHLDLVPNLSTHTFLNSSRQFAAR